MVLTGISSSAKEGSGFVKTLAAICNIVASATLRAGGHELEKSLVGDPSRLSCLHDAGRRPLYLSPLWKFPQD